MVASKNITEHPYSVSSQLNKPKVFNSKDIIRPKPSIVPKKQIFADEKQASSFVKSRADKENIGHQGASNYDYQAYSNKPKSKFLLTLTLNFKLKGPSGSKIKNLKYYQDYI